MARHDLAHVAGMGEPRANGAYTVRPQPHAEGRRTAAAAAIAVSLLASIAAMFWWQDVRFSLPTPVPPDWQAVAPGTRVQLPPALDRLRRAAGDRPVLLHFFNPACPCSRFNVDHVRELARRYEGRVTFIAVLVQDDPAVLAAAYRTLDLDIPYHTDDGLAAAAVGAYSTPQAAIIDRDGRLAYRGNYNTSRYCRDRDTEFARLALEDVLAVRPSRAMPALATTSYGCPLRRRQSPARDGA